MSEIRPIKILSFSSEDELYPAKNLLRGSSSYQWKCKNSLDTQSYVEFQFESLAKFSRIDIGNSSSAFIEIQVSSITDHEHYQVLLALTPLLSPSEALKCENLNRVRFFKEINFTKSVASQKWNVLKVICTQPFNKTLSYGLSFIKFYEIPLNENDVSFSSGSETHSLVDKVQSNEPHIDLDKLLTAKSNQIENLRPGCLFRQRSKADSSINEELKIKNTESESISKNSEKKFPSFQKTEVKGDSSHLNLINLNSQVEQPHRVKSSISLKRKHDSLTQDISEIKGTRKPINYKSSFLKNPNDINTTKSETSEINKVKTVVPVTLNSQYKINYAPISSNNYLQPGNSALNSSVFSNVIFVLSGYQNPLRNKIKDQALSLGAQYRASWVDDCTHLICAYHNTPKFKEVCGKGIIVTEKWIFDCYNEKKLLPWRKYRVTGALSPVKSINSHPIESTKPVNKNSNLPHSSGISFQSNADDIHHCVVNDELLTSNSTCLDFIPELPDIFTGQDFFFYGNFDNEALRQLKRLIIAFNGTVHSFMSCEVRIVLTHSAWDEHFDEALGSNSELKFVKPEWIYLCDEQGSLVPFDEFEILK